MAKNNINSDKRQQRSVLLKRNSNTATASQTKKAIIFMSWQKIRIVLQKTANSITVSLSAGTRQAYAFVCPDKLLLHDFQIF